MPASHVTNRTAAQASATDSRTNDTPRKGEHERFIADVLDLVKRDRHLPGNAFKVAYEIALHVNRKTRLAWPSQTTIAGNTGLSESTVKKMIGLLRARGHLEIEAGGGRGRSTRYRLIINAEKGRDHAPFVEPQKGSRSAEKGVAFGEIKGSRSRPRPSERDLGASYEAPKEEGEREAQSLARRAGPADLRAGAGAPPRSEEDSGEQGKQGKQEILPPARALPWEDQLRSLRAIWPRPWLDDPDAERRAYAGARQGTPADEIQAGARAWVAAADAPRYLPPLAKWLAARGWEKLPPAKRARHGQETANHHHPRGRPNLSGMMMSLEDAS
jgi:biotin operon repressor